MATDWQPRFNDIIEESFQRARLNPEAISPWQRKSARDSLNHLFVEISNRTQLDWKLQPFTVQLTQGTATYALPAEVIDITAASVRTDAVADYDVNRINEKDYTQLPNKSQQGRPTMMFLHRVSPPEVILWPTPSDSQWELYFWATTRQDDVEGLLSHPDFPYRFTEAITAGLALRVADKFSDNEPLIARLERRYADALMEASESDDSGVNDVVAMDSVL